jgi:hypothetical protein
MLDKSIAKKLVGGLAVRLLLAPFLGHPFDLRIFMAVGWATAHGITPYGQYALQEIFVSTPHPHFYGVFPGIGYPPTWGLICGLMYLVSFWTSNLYLYTFALKVPIILADLAAANLVYNILAVNIGPEKASKALSLFLFCPFILAIGAVWGMFDVIPLYFTLLSVLYLPKKWKYSSIMLAIASAFKQIPLLLVPTYSILSYKKYKSRRIALQYLFLSASLFAFLTLTPMVLFQWDLTNMYNAFSYSAVATIQPYYEIASFPMGAASPFNVFLLLNRIQPDLDVQYNSTLSYLWMPAVAITYFYIMRKTKSKVNVDLTIQYSLLTTLVFFTTRTWVSEPNLIFLFTFAMMAILLKSGEYKVLVRKSKSAYEVFIQELGSYKNVHALWLLLFCFVMVNVPVISFLWMIEPWTLNAATSFADSSLGWTRFFLMTSLTLAWLALTWRFVVKILMGVKAKR